ncbi:MAG: transposase [Okeania sp. SIO3B3]|nr:transposase [Okeania sp. SIO3B3]
MNEARENAESMIDFLWQFCAVLMDKKPRDYRVVARRDFLSFTKRRRPGLKVRRKALRKQLCYLKRDIRLVEELLELIYENKELDVDIPVRMLERLETLKTVFEQQEYMYRNKVNKVDSRIVSISQPHIRPIVRGKAGKNVEFGAKISLSLSDGFSFIDHLSWENFNEAKDLIFQIEKYKERFGYYPESVHADQIYHNRENRNYCTDRDIRISGKPLGRPKKVTDENREELLQKKKLRRQDELDRIAVEGRFGVAKRKFGLGLIKSKLQETNETDIHVSIFIMNLDKMCSEELAEIKDKYRIKGYRAA